MPKEKQRLSTGKRGPRPKGDPFLPAPGVDTSVRELEIDILNTGSPAKFGLESLTDAIVECNRGMAHLATIDTNHEYYSNIHKVSLALIGLNRTLLEFTKYCEDHSKLREHAKNEIMREVAHAFSRDPDLAQRVCEFMDQTVVD